MFVPDGDRSDRLVPGVWIRYIITRFSTPHRIVASKPPFNGRACKKFFLEKLFFARRLGMRGKERVPSPGLLPVA
jgi:hypothetical protein